MKITTICDLDGKEYTMEINCSENQLKFGMLLYEKGALLQNAFSFLNADEREFLKTGITPERWDAMFSDEEKE